MPDLGLDWCRKYIAYIDGVPAGIIESSRGETAAMISWVGVKSEFRRRGLCHAMLVHAINNDIADGVHQFVLRHQRWDICLI